MRIGIFYDQEIPYEGVRPDQKAIDSLSQYGEIINLKNYPQKLEMQYDVLINLQGKYFIKDAWKFIKSHLKKGGGLIHVGDGAPFSSPIARGEDGWFCEREQTAYHEEINIFQASRVYKERINFLKVNEDLPVLKEFEKCFSIQDTVGYVVKFSQGIDIRGEAGSCGPIDAKLYPLLDGYKEQGRKTAAPVVMIENTKGQYEGGRWIFINQKTDSVFWEYKGVELLKVLRAYVAEKVYEVEARSNYASFYPGEQPTILLQLQSFSEQEEVITIKIEIDKDGSMVYQKELQVNINVVFQLISIPTDIRVETGIYTIEVGIYKGETIDRILRNGFWGYDRELLQSGSLITCDKDYFYKDGEPMPVVGMTYMQPDVHRKFIHRPNVYLWDQDFETMKAAGINMVRTGIWTSFKSIMPSDGFVSEEVLRVFDAMFLTAKKHDMPIVFNFFAFAPEMWSGVNPYMDPRSIKAQKRYINAVVTRHQNSKGVMWDLINEPSVSNPQRLWETRPNGDAYELMEWRKWLENRHKTVERLQEKWNYTNDEISSFKQIELPKEGDFSDNTTHYRHGLKAHDYYMFTQDMFNKWATEMSKGIRGAKAQQLITVGQDEAMATRRPHPLMSPDSIDYTSNHSWWHLDDLYWDGIFSKAPHKPNLIQETGIMNVNDPSGKRKLTETYTRNMLERKYAHAFAGDNAGAVQWVWNVNNQMDNLNESTIGVVRPDGGQKLESDVSYDFGEFMKEVGYIFKGRKEADVVVIHPFANNFSVCDYSVMGTKKLTRILGYHMSRSFKVYGEYHLEGLKPEKLMMLPSPRTLTTQAFERLLACVKKGSTLYMSGPFSEDEYWGRIDNRSETLGIETELKSVSREESMIINKEQYRVSFGDLKINWVDKEVEIGVKENILKVIQYGDGKIIWSPLPLEMNEQDQVIQAAYEYALHVADVGVDFTWVSGKSYGVLGKKLEFEAGDLYIFVSESSQDEEVEIKDESNQIRYKFLVPSQRIMMFATDQSGTIIKTYKDWDVDVTF